MRGFQKSLLTLTFVEDTFVRQFKKKTSFFLVLSSLNRIFAGKFSYIYNMFNYLILKA